MSEAKGAYPKADLLSSIPKPTWWKKSPTPQGGPRFHMHMVLRAFAK